MTEKDNPLKNAELSTEQNTDHIDSIINNTAPPTVPAPETLPLDKVKEPTPRKRSRERGER